MSEPAFISHVSEEAEVAIHLKNVLQDDFLRLLKVFVSSDGESISTGKDWLQSIDAALRQSKLVMILCSPTSIRRPWIFFEAGAAWIQQIPLIPLCHAGLTPSDLPMPLSTRMAVSLAHAEGLRRL
jgi:TIR domain